MARIKLLHNNVYYVKEHNEKKITPRLNKQRSVRDLYQFLKLKNNEAIIILESGYINRETKSIINTVKELSINKIYFFIEDVVRIECVETNLLDTYTLEDPNVEYAIPEIEIIKHIIRKTECQYEIYHCEYNSKIIEKKYNINLKYYDLFFIGWLFDHRSNKSFNNVFNKEFKYKLSCFNLRKDYHRTFIVSLLYNLPDTLLTLNNVISAEDIRSNKALPINKFSLEIAHKIITNTNETYLDYNNLTLDTNPSKIINNKQITLSGRKQQHTKLYMNEAFVNLVTETRYATPTVYISEKTLKPILGGRPFILLGAPGTLALLKTLGFKTFDKFWSEEYDTITDHTLRFETVYHLVNSILAKSDEELTAMLSEMYDILEHNYNHLYSNFNEIFFNLNN